MRSQSAIRPDEIQVRKREKGQALIRLRRNIAETTGQEGDLLYDYEETNVSIADRRGLVSYIEQYFDDLFAMGLASEQKPPEPTLEERIAELEAKIG